MCTRMTPGCQPATSPRICWTGAVLSTLSVVPSVRALSPSEPGCPQQHGWRLLGTLCQPVHCAVAAALLSPCTLYAALNCCCQGFFRGGILAVHVWEQVVLCAKCLGAVCKVPGKVWAPVLVAWLYMYMCVCCRVKAVCVHLCVILHLVCPSGCCAGPLGSPGPRAGASSFACLHRFACLPVSHRTVQFLAPGYSAVCCLPRALN